MGLLDAIESNVGNDLIKGLSGGERRRLSIAEVFLGGSSIQCWDDSTRGLDSNNALGFIRTLRAYAKERHNVSIVAPKQASQELFCTFDKVTLLYEGFQTYFGDAGAAKAYFVRPGFECPESE